MRSGAERSATASIGRPFRSNGCWGRGGGGEKKGGERNQICCSAHPKQPDRVEPGGFKGADVRIGCRYSLSPLAAAASRFAPTTPTCFPSIKATATASQRRRKGPLSRDHGALKWVLVCWTRNASSATNDLYFSGWYFIKLNIIQQSY